MALLQAPNIAQQIQTASNTVPQTNLLTQQGFEAQQRANYLEEQAKATDLANQKTQMMMPLLQSGLTTAQQAMNGSAPAASNINPPNSGNDMGGVAEALQPQGTTTQEAPTAAGASPSSIQDSDSQLAAINAHVDAWAAKRFAPVPMAMDAGTAHKMAAMQFAAKTAPELAGLPDLIQTSWDQQQQLAKQNVERDAVLTARNAYSIMTSPNPRATFDAIDHDDAKMLSPNMTDAQIKEYAQHVYRGAFQATGRSPTITTEGAFVDPLTGAKISDAQVNLSKEQWAKIRETGVEKVPMTINGILQQVPRYEAAGYANLNAYSMAMAGQQSQNNGGPPASGGTSTTSSTGPTGAPNTPLPTGFTQAKPNAPDGMVLGQVPKGQVSVDLSQFTKSPTVPKTGELTGALLKSATDAAGELPTVAAKAAIEQRGAQKGQFIDQHLLSILDTINTGPKSQDLQGAQAFFHMLNGGNKTWMDNFMHNDPDNFAVMNKWLGDIGMKQVGQDVSGEGATARFSALLANIGMKNLSANVDLPRGAIRAMLKYDMASNMYDNQKWGTDWSAAKSAGVRPGTYDSDYNAQKDFGTYVKGTIAQIDDRGNLPSKPATQPTGPEITSQADYDKLPANAFYTSGGQPHYKGGQKK